MNLINCILFNFFWSNKLFLKILLTKKNKSIVKKIIELVFLLLNYIYQNLNHILWITTKINLWKKGKSGFYDCNSQTIFVNDNYPATRNLFTIAHEIGHFILHQGSQNRFNEYHKYTEEELAREKVANNFAGELLMPQYKFKEAFDEVRGDIKKLANRFGVSIRAIEIRSFRLGLIDNI